MQASKGPVIIRKGPISDKQADRTQSIAAKIIFTVYLYHFVKQFAEELYLSLSAANSRYSHLYCSSLLWDLCIRESRILTRRKFQGHENLVENRTTLVEIFHKKVQSTPIINLRGFLIGKKKGWNDGLASAQIRWPSQK